MFYTTILFTVLLSLTSHIIAAPAPLIDPDPIILRANATGPLLKPNSTEVIPYHIDRTPLTLLITPLLGQTIPRNDLIIALYDSREYTRRQIRFHGDKRLIVPFDSTKLPAPPAVNCVLKVGSGKGLKGMTWGFLEDVVQGVMDYTFFPYSATVNSATFVVRHEVWGEVGRGSLEGVGVAVGAGRRILRDG